MRGGMLVATLCAVAVAAACGGGGNGRPATSGPLTLEQYFQRLDEVDNRAQERFDAIAAQLRTDLPEDEALALLQEVFPQQVATFKDLLAGVQALEPPDEVRDAHEEAVAALRDFVELSEEGAKGVAEATSLRAVTGLLNSAEANAANERLTTSCLALEGAAADHGITVDLDCE